MAFVKDLYRDEFRDGFLVQSDRKKVWERWLEILQEIDRICRKYEICYWASEGTLLGAARHKGFIPWVRNMNLCMTRPDFNYFCMVAEEELDKDKFEVAREVFLSLQVYHKQTTLLRAEDPAEIKYPQGLLIEIFPLDFAPDGTPQVNFVLGSVGELLGAVCNFPALAETVKNGGKIINDWADIEKIHALGTLDEQFKFLDITLEGLIDCSSSVNFIKKTFIDRVSDHYQKDWFRETIYLPFEDIEVPVPVDYEKILTARYGDWHELIRDKENDIGLFVSADIPYKKFIEQINFEMLFEKKADDKEAD